MLILERPGWYVTPVSIDGEALRRYCYLLKGAPGVEFLYAAPLTAGRDFPTGIRVPRNAMLLLGAPLDNNRVDCVTRPGAPFTLRPYQQEAVQFLKSHNGGILAHDLGTGKTSTSIAASEDPICVMCPVSAIEVWKLEFELWNIDYQVLQGTKTKRSLVSREASAYIIPYTSYKWTGFFNRGYPVRKIHTVILDEAHYTQKKDVKWSKDARILDCEQKILLTATPIRNRLRSLWSLLNIAQPNAWGYLHEFRKRYCGAVEGDHGLVDGEPTNVDELRTRLADVIHVQNWNHPSMQGLRPPLERRVVPIELSTNEKRQINSSAINYLRQRGNRSGQTLVLDGKLRAAGGLAKARHTAQMLPEFLSCHKRIVFWFWFKQTLDLFRSAIPKDIDTDIVTGSSTATTRRRVIEEWRFGDHNKQRILLATLPSFSAAVSLTTADAEVFIEFSDAPLDVQQAEKRIHRPGSKHPKVYAYYMRAEGTREDRVVSNILSKIEEIEDLFGEDPQTIQIREIAE